MKKITYHNKQYRYNHKDIIDWWDKGIPMIITCISGKQSYIIYLNEYGDVEKIMNNCK